MITLTDKGAEKVHEFLASQGTEVETAGLRVGVRGGGCSGFQYALAFDQERDGDVVCEVTDGGRLDDPLAGRRTPAPSEPGGRGLWLMNQLCDLVELRATAAGVTLRLHMALA